MRLVMKVIGFMLLALICIAKTARSQPARADSSPKKVVKAYIDQDVERHKWEIGINAGHLFKLGGSGTYHYPYMIKRNFKIGQSGIGKALRFSFSPMASTGTLRYPFDTLPLGHEVRNNYCISPQFSIGHEWQKSRGRTMIFGGADLAGMLDWDKSTLFGIHSPFDNNVVGASTVKSQKHLIWLGAFLGCKMYLNHRIAISLESQIQFIRGFEGHKVWFEKTFLSKTRENWHRIDPLSNYFLNLSYNL